MRDFIKFCCPECKGAKMASIWPMDIDVDDTESLEEIRQLLTEGFPPVIEQHNGENPVQWCKCKS